MGGKRNKNKNKRNSVSKQPNKIIEEEKENNDP